jgi:hypothetical protein
MEEQRNNFIVLDLGIRWNQAPAILILGKGSQLPLDKRLGGHQSQRGHHEEEENPLPMLGITACCYTN